MSRNGNEPLIVEDTDQATLQSGWADRQQALGNVPQAVLLRNLPAGLNALLDRWHRQLLRWVFASDVASSDSKWIADLGCGYGRMASELRAMGFTRIVGLDYEAGFCRQYEIDHGFAVRGSIASPPFESGSLSGAYAVTAFMYVGFERAAKGLAMLDDALIPGSRVLLLEAGAEFNRASRAVLRRKRSQSLVVDGFTRDELCKAMAPGTWKAVGSGSNIWTTAFLPLLMLVARWPRVFAKLEGMVSHMDRPRPGFRDGGLHRFCLHRWVLFEKPLNPAPRR